MRLGQFHKPWSSAHRDVAVAAPAPAATNAAAAALSSQL